MKRKMLRTIWFCIGICLFLGQFLMATEGQVHSLVLVVDYEINPGKADVFDSSVQEINRILEKYDFPFSFEVLKTDDSHGYLIYKLENFADIDRMNKFWDDLQQKMGDEDFKALWQIPDDAFRIVGSSFWDRRTDISYQPSQSLISGGEKAKSGHAALYFYHVKQGQEIEAESIFKQTAAISKNNRTTAGYDIYESRFGPPRLVYIILFNANTLEESLLQKQKNKEKMGKESQACLDGLENRFKGIIDGTSIRHGSWQPHLAFNKKK